VFHMSVGMSYVLLSVTVCDSIVSVPSRFRIFNLILCLNAQPISPHPLVTDYCSY
jgi:hypothetical protein